MSGNVNFCDLSFIIGIDRQTDLVQPLNSIRRGGTIVRVNRPQQNSAMRTNCVAHGRNWFDLILLAAHQAFRRKSLGCARRYVHELFKLPNLFLCRFEIFLPGF